jgi:hypothetical protein
MKARFCYLLTWGVVVAMAPGCGRQSQPAPEATTVQVAAANQADEVPEAAAHNEGEGDPVEGSMLDELDATTLGKGGAGRSGGSAPGKSAPRSSPPAKSAPKTASGAPGKTAPKTGGAASNKSGKTGGEPHGKTGGAPSAKTAPRNAPPITKGGAGTPPASANNTTPASTGRTSPSKGGQPSQVVVRGGRTWAPASYRNTTEFFNYNVVWFFEWVYENGTPDDVETISGTTGPDSKPKKGTPSDAEIDDLIKDLNKAGAPKGSAPEPAADTSPAGGKVSLPTHFDKLDLTQEQLDKMARIAKPYDDRISELKRKMKDAVTVRVGTTGIIIAAKKAINKITAERTEALEGALTQKQRDKLRELRGS